MCDNLDWRTEPVSDYKGPVKCLISAVHLGHMWLGSSGLYCPGRSVSFDDENAMWGGYNNLMRDIDDKARQY